MDNNKDDVLDGWFDSFVSGRFLKSFIEWITSVIQTADTSLVLLILVVLPLLVPAVPAYVTYKNLFEQMGFDKPIAILGGVTIELLGYAGALLTLKAITDLIENSKSTMLRWVAGINGMAYLFYLVAVVGINVMLDQKAGKDSTYVFVIALLCLLSVPSGLLSATRIVGKEKKEEEQETRLEEETREEKEKRERREEEERQARLAFQLEQMRMDAQHKRDMEAMTLTENARIEKQKLKLQNQLQRNSKFEVPTSKNTSNDASNPSRSTEKVKSSEAVPAFIEAFLKQNNRLPQTKDLMAEFGMGQTNAYYMMVTYKVKNGELLVSSGIIGQDDLDKALRAYEKMPKAKG